MEAKLRYCYYFVKVYPISDHVGLANALIDLMNDSIDLMNGFLRMGLKTNLHQTRIEPDNQKPTFHGKTYLYTNRL